MVIEVHFIHGDQVGGDDGVRVRVDAGLREGGLGVTEGGRGRKGRRGRRGRRLSSVLWRSLDRGLASETVDHEACRSRLKTEEV